MENLNYNLSEEEFSKGIKPVTRSFSWIEIKELVIKEISRKGYQKEVGRHESDPQF